jgi:hypothetical protein
VDDGAKEFYDKFVLDLASSIPTKDIKDVNTPTNEVCLKCGTEEWFRSGDVLVPT